MFGDASVGERSDVSRYLRIHGDNIVECERTLELIRAAFKGTLVSLEGPLYKPKYCLSSNDLSFIIELLSGHGRWGVDVVSVVQHNGGILHEGADSYVTELQGEEETIIFALEYCSALPAGNNAWQRNGRALSSVIAGIPYLHYAEIGGSELDENRNIKSARFPNPVVPFSYVATSVRYDCCCIPVYKSHPSITDKLYKKYQNIFGLEQSLDVIKGLICHEDIKESIDILVQKGLELIRILSDSRRFVDTLRGEQWGHLLLADNPVEWLVDNTLQLRWKKKSAEKVMVSDTFEKLLTEVKNSGYLTVGGRDVPICIVPKEKVALLENRLSTLYPDLDISLDKRSHLVIVWITGFKPRGDDSRPDRGLAPLSRMLVGLKAAMMCVVSGPAKEKTWDKLADSIDCLCSENGLWKAVFQLSNYVLIDSVTIDRPKFYRRDMDVRFNRDPICFPIAGNPDTFTEDDVDCAIHQIFAHKNEVGIYEGLCNPPGGDWSGITCFEDSVEYRWTSLPRVSGVSGKRPDHVIQIALDGMNIFFCIESKGLGYKIENSVGAYLAGYLKNVFQCIPTACRKKRGEWRKMENEIPFIRPYIIVSIGAFIYKSAEELSDVIVRGNLDAVIALEFDQKSIVHLLDVTIDRIVEKTLLHAQQLMNGFEVQIH